MLSSVSVIICVTLQRDGKTMGTAFCLRTFTYFLTRTNVQNTVGHNIAQK